MTGSGRRLELSAPRLTRPVVITAAVLILVVGLAVAFALTRDSEDDPGAREPSGPTTATPSEVTGVAADAQRVLTTWARPQTPYARWWRDLKPLLTPAAEQAYAGTDTAQLPDLGEVTRPEVVTGIGPDASTVWFETDRGRFGVDLSRTAQGQPWRMVRVLFPGQDSTYQ